MVEGANLVRAYPLLPKEKISWTGLDDEDGNKEFREKLSKTVALLQQVVKQSDELGGDGEETTGDEGDEEDELHDFEIKDVTSGSVGSGIGKKSFRHFKNLTFMCINEEKRAVEKLIEVKGNFQLLLLNPWWEHNMSLREPNRGGRIKIIKEPPLVRLRNDTSVDDAIVLIFLRKCGVESQHIKLLHEVAFSENKKVSFSNIYEILDSMEKDETLKEISMSTKMCIQNSDQGKLFHCKTFVKYCSSLFPTHTLNILNTLNLEDLKRLDNHISKRPWELGYMAKMKQQFDLKGVEVKLKGFIESKLIYKMSKLMKDSLYVYNAMKNLTYNEGHTYITSRQLTCSRLYSARNATLKRDMNEADITRALSYLTEEKILAKDVLMSGEEVLVFPHIRGYEVAIANAVSQLMTGKPCLSEEAVDVADFKGDLDQLAAAKMMTKKPVVVISGPGGCGKTYVVSKLLSRIVVKCPLHSETNKDQEKTGANAKDIEKTKAVSTKENAFFDKSDGLTANWLDDYITQNCDLSFGDELKSSKTQNKERSLNGNGFDSAKVPGGTCPSDENALNGVKSHENVCSFDEEELKAAEVSCVDEHSPEGSARHERVPFEVNIMENLGSQTDVSCFDENALEDSRSQETLSYTSDSKEEPEHDDVRSNNEVFDDECLITAPTGRAAVIIGRRGGIKAYTMHQVIFSYIAYCRGASKDDQGWRFKETRILICDECSLISVRLFSMLIGILQVHARLSQIVLLGDICQLPSIEPGNLLADLFFTLKSYSAAIRLSQNHRAESKLIIENAQRISRQYMPTFDENNGFVPACIGNDDELPIKVKSLLESKELGLKKGEEKSQFIAFRRKDCDLINELCCQHYNKHATRNEKNRRNFQINDKICATRNKEVIDIEHKQTVKITNGEIFFLREDHEVEERGKKQRHWIIDDLERQLKIDYKDIRKLRMKHAYARTIHTYQGSESEIIIYVVGKPWYQTCQHVYTAITRGKRQAVVLFDESSLARAVASPPRQRNTRLRFYLTQKLKETNVKPEEDGNEISEDSLGGLEEEELFENTKNEELESFLPNEDDDDDFFGSIDESLLTPSKKKSKELDSRKKQDYSKCPSSGNANMMSENIETYARVISKIRDQEKDEISRHWDSIESKQVSSDEEYFTAIESPVKTPCHQKTFSRTNRGECSEVASKQNVVDAKQINKSEKVIDGIESDIDLFDFSDEDIEDFDQYVNYDGNLRGSKRWKATSNGNSQKSSQKRNCRKRKKEPVVNVCSKIRNSGENTKPDRKKNVIVNKSNESTTDEEYVSDFDSESELLSDIEDWDTFEPDENFGATCTKRTIVTRSKTRIGNTK